MESKRGKTVSTDTLTNGKKVRSGEEINEDHVIQHAVTSQSAPCGLFAGYIGDSCESGVQRLSLPWESMQVVSVAPRERRAARLRGI